MIKFNISHTTNQNASILRSVLTAVKSPIQTLFNSGNQAQIQRAMNKITAQTGVSDISTNGVSFVESGRKIILSSDNPYTLRLSEQNLKTNNIEKDLFVSNNGSITAKGFQDKTAVEKFVDDVYQILDFPLLQLRRILTCNNLSTLFERVIVNRAKLNTSNMQSVNDIISLFKKIDKNIMSIENPVSRSTIKNGYENVMTGVRGSKQLTFKDLNGSNYTVNVLADHQSMTNLLIRIANKNGNVTNIIIEPNGSVLKSKKINRKCIIGENSEYYTQQELGNLKFEDHISTLKSELEKYNEYIMNKLEHRSQFKAMYSTSSVGKIDESISKTIENLKDKYNIMRKALLSLKDTERKTLAKKKLRIETFPGQNQAIIYKNIGGNGDNIHMSYPMVQGKPSIKILVLTSEGKIKDSFLIQEDKLVKFNPTDTAKSKRSDVVLNYHTQEEINSSNLSQYLYMLDNRLSYIAEIISKGAGWYR